MLQIKFYRQIIHECELNFNNFIADRFITGNHKFTFETFTN